MYKIRSAYKKLIADVVTPVSLYLKLRDKYANSILLESSDYHAAENSFSYICCNPIASFVLKNRKITLTYPDQVQTEKNIKDKAEAIGDLSLFMQSFSHTEFGFNFITNGLFGYMAYDAVEYFEDIDLSSSEKESLEIPEICYTVFRNVIVINHFKSELYVFDHMPEGSGEKDNLNELITLIKSKNFPHYSFELTGEESSNVPDKDFLEMIRKGREHCLRGDVFQIVLSRRFESAFRGDDFMVYRALRAINPSPYLFYFDYGNYKIFGSSPEAQIVIKNRRASIYPIAGTFRRTGHDHEDAELAKRLSEDPKEDSEHVMLVDLARNDLSRNGSDVEVEKFKEIQFYSHVIHLVSKVSGNLPENTGTIRIVADTFPAGTLSGAPKHMAMNLIHRYEPTRRGYYGGAIGFLGFNGDFNHAIMIRSFFSQGNTLFYQAGAGVVAKSVPENELQEVNNKLEALRKALLEAMHLSDN
ncbi:MAG: anthranilate synthase component I family protein [Cyclobacteriaceae bacterium]|nr:anthranilate synthase component I family protein [Cyclobacteriaceae bacterium]